MEFCCSAHAESSGQPTRCESGIDRKVSSVYAEQVRLVRRIIMMEGSWPPLASGIDANGFGGHETTRVQLPVPSPLRTPGLSISSNPLRALQRAAFGGSNDTHLCKHDFPNAHWS